MRRNYITIFILLFFHQNLWAQGDYLSFGIGPSLLYADNSGEYRKFKFKVQPAIKLSYNKQLTEYIGLRGSLGTQNFNSGGFDQLNQNYVINWGNQDQAFDFRGKGYFADVMPIFTTNPNTPGKVNSTLQFYVGLGLGVMFVEREQEILKNGVLNSGELVGGDIVISNETNIIPYIPIRTGLSTNLKGDWDFALEFVLMTTTNSELDGNNIKTKEITPDMSGQILFIVKRYFGKAR